MRKDEHVVRSAAALAAGIHVFRHRALRRGGVWRAARRARSALRGGWAHGRRARAAAGIDALRFGDGWLPGLRVADGHLERAMQQDAHLSIEAPAAGTQRISFQAEAYFRPLTLAVTLNGQLLGTFRISQPWSLQTIDLGRPLLRQGNNTFVLHAEQGEAGTIAGWPALAQVCRIHREVEYVSGAPAGTTREEWAYALTSLPPEQATAARLEQLWRGHWQIENGLHYVRDVTLDEDACQVRMEHAPANLVARRNAALNLLRRAGVTNVAAALRRHAMYPCEALALMGIALE